MGNFLILLCAPVSNKVKAMPDLPNHGEFFEQHKLTCIKMFKRCFTYLEYYYLCDSWEISIHYNNISQ